MATARVVTPVNPLSLLGATKLVNSVDEVVEAGGQAGVAAVRGEQILLILHEIFVTKSRPPRTHTCNGLGSSRPV